MLKAKKKRKKKDSLNQLGILTGFQKEFIKFE